VSSKRSRQIPPPSAATPKFRQTDLAWRALRPGGVFLGYVPTVLQVKGFVDSLKEHGGFACIDTMETLVRYWHLKEMSVRPQHRMVAHTGFVTTARRVEKEASGAPERREPAE